MAATTPTITATAASIARTIDQVRAVHECEHHDHNDHDDDNADDRNSAVHFVLLEVPLFLRHDLFVEAAEKSIRSALLLDIVQVQVSGLH